MSDRPLSERVREASTQVGDLQGDYIGPDDLVAWADEIAALEAELADCEYQRQQAVRLNVKNAKVIRALEGGDG